MNRNRWIAVLVIFVALMFLFLYGSILLLITGSSSPGYTGQREPLARLGYCSAGSTKPCILSFSLNTDGNMVIDLLAENFSSAGFYLKIRQAEHENIYKCQKTKGLSMNVSCTGRTLPVGEALQFLLISANDDTPFAEGRFPIIGLALATPDIAPTATLSPPPIPGKE